MLNLKKYYFSRESDLLSSSVIDEDKSSIKISLRVRQKMSNISDLNLATDRGVPSPNESYMVNYKKAKILINFYKYYVILCLFELL